MDKPYIEIVYYHENGECGKAVIGGDFLKEEFECKLPEFIYFVFCELKKKIGGLV